MALGAAVLSGDAAAARAPKPPKPYVILAGPFTKGPVPGDLPPALGRHHLKDVIVTVEYLRPADRSAFVARAGTGTADPFAVAPGRPEAWTAFRVLFENGAAEDITFQPGNVVLLTDHREQQFPVDLTDLYRLAVMKNVTDPDGVMRRMNGVMFDSSTQIRAGSRMERLLVFGMLPEKFKEFRILFSFLQVGHETRTFSFLFHKRVLEG